MTKTEQSIFPGASDKPLPVVGRGELPLLLHLRRGGQAEAILRYELLGNAGAPLLIVAGGISAGRHVLASTEFPDDGWWQAQISSLDLTAHRILAIDWIGADGALDLPVDPADQAEAIRHLLDQLQIARAAAFIGASYGAMVGMHFAALCPDRLRGLLAISAANRPHPFASAQRALQRQALALGEQFGDPAAGVELARAMAILTYRTPEEFRDRFPAEPAVADHGFVRVAAEDYLDAQGRRYSGRMSSTAYRRLSESIDLHRIDASEITVPLTLAAVDHDALVPAADVQSLAAQVPGSRFHLIRSRYGHDAFLKEEAQVAAIISQFLNSLEYSE
jgi:homoserine O-acetyltransferase/O-succinyltransferase